jgi:hypothetical protein
MKHTRFVRFVGLCLLLCLSSVFTGCGAQSQQVELEKEDENGMLVARKGIRSYTKQQRESGNKAPASGQGASRRRS